MRYYIIFGITLILLLIILFYNPYLGVYKDKVTIEYDFDQEGYYWKYEIDNNNLILKEESENTWVFIPNKNGKTELKFYYTNGEDNKYTIFYTFKVRKNKIFWLNGEGYGLLSYPNPY